MINWFKRLLGKNNNKMSNLRELFNQREFAYLTLSQDILDEIGPTVLDAALEMLNIEDEDVSWEDVQLVDDVITLVAFVLYRPGDIAITEAKEKVLITEENMDIYKRIIRIGVPLNIAETGTKEDIITFLKNIQATKNANNSNEPDTKMLEAKMKLTYDGFDTSDLSDDQLSQLQNNPNKDKKLH